MESLTGMLSLVPVPAPETYPPVAYPLAPLSALLAYIIAATTLATAAAIRMAIV